MSFNPQIEHAFSFVLTSSDGVSFVTFSTTYHGTITGGAGNAYAGKTFTITGFTNPLNNGTYLCTASSATTLDLFNFQAFTPSPETHAAVATSCPAMALCGTLATVGTPGFIPSATIPQLQIALVKPVVVAPGSLNLPTMIGAFSEYHATTDGDDTPIFLTKSFKPTSDPASPLLQVFEADFISDPSFTGDASGSFLASISTNNSLRGPGHYGQHYAFYLEHGCNINSGTDVHVDDMRRMYIESLHGNGAGSGAVYNFGRHVGYNCATGGVLGPQRGTVGTNWGMNFEGPRINGLWSLGLHYGIRMASQHQGKAQGTFTLSAAAAITANVTLTLTDVVGEPSPDSFPNVATYNGTITGGGSGAFQGYWFVITGFSNANNNGTFYCVQSTASTLSLVNSNAADETAASSAVLNTTDYTGTITGGGSNAYAGQAFTIAGFANTGGALTLSACGTPTTGGQLSQMVKYIGTITGGNDNAYQGRTFAVAGFATGGNNGTFLCYGSSDTYLWLGNTSGSAAAETHAATATPQTNNGIGKCKASTTTTLTVNNPYATVETHAGTAKSSNSNAWGIHQDDSAERNAFGSINLGGDTGPLMSSGSASPEASIFSNVGGLYLRTGGGPGSVLYIKTQGAVTTNTNWGALSPRVAVVDLTNQGAAIGATLLYAVPAAGAGMYRISWSATVTTTDGGGSTLGGTSGFQIQYTSPTDSVVKLTVAQTDWTSNANTTGTAVGGTAVVYAKLSTNINYLMDYTSTTPGTMKYELHVEIEAM